MDDQLQTDFIEGARKGDQSAMYELFTQTRDWAYFAAKRYIREEKPLAGFLKDVYVIAFGRIEDMPPDRSFHNWLSFVLTTKAMAFLRGRKIKLEAKEEFFGLSDDSPLFPEAWLDQEQKRADVLRMIDTLPDGQRLVVNFYYLSGLSVPEIAMCMGIKEGMVNTYLHHAKSALRVTTSDTYDEFQPIPLLTRLMEREILSAPMPTDVAKNLYQEMMLFFMSGGKVPRLAAGGTAKASSGGDAASGGFLKYLPWILTIVVMLGALAFLFWNFQRTQKEIGEKLVAQYEQSKAAVEAEDAAYESEAAQGEPPPPPNADGTQPDASTADPNAGTQPNASTADSNAGTQPDASIADPNAGTQPDASTANSNAQAGQNVGDTITIPA